MRIELQEYTEVFLNLSWIWLNDPEIRKLTDTPVFDRNRQKTWFKHLTERKDYKIWGLTVDNKQIGACGLKNITNWDCEYWGYIGEKEYLGKGLGGDIIELMETEAKQLNLKSIWLKVSNFNKRAIKLYEKYGYNIEKEDRDLSFMRKTI